MLKLFSNSLFSTHVPTIYRGCRYLSKLSYIHHTGKVPLQYVTAGRILELVASKYGPRQAIVSKHQNKSVSFKELLEQTDKLASGFNSLGLQKGDRIGIWAPNSVEWVFVMMACLRAGLILVTINPAYQPPEVEYCINKVGIKALVCPDKFHGHNYYEILKAISPELGASEPGRLKSKRLPSLETVVIISEKSFSGTYSLDEVFGFAEESGIKTIKNNQLSILPDDGCNIQFTSGSTGQPKATLLSHFNIVNNGYQTALRAEFCNKEHKLCVQVPFFHTFGITIGIIGSITCGTTIVLPSPLYNSNETLNTLEAEQCTIVCGTPTMYVDLVNNQRDRNVNLSSLEIAITGGAPCSPHLFQQMLNVLKLKKVKSIYGLTETTAVSFESLPDEDEYKSTATVGHVSDHLEVKVIDSEGRLVPYGTPGELCVRGYVNMTEYWMDEGKSKEMIGSDKWLRTGDTFILEENGYGRIVGRLKEFINRGGENIYPREIEDYINTHPDVLECYVIGLSHERLGEEVCACIRLKKGRTLTREDLVNYCKGKLAYFKIPSQVRLVEDFPKTQSGKVQKFKLIEKFDKKENRI